MLRASHAGAMGMYPSGGQMQKYIYFLGEPLKRRGQMQKCFNFQRISHSSWSQRKIDALLQDKRLVGEASSKINAFLQDRSLAEWIMWRRIEVSISY